MTKESENDTKQLNQDIDEPILIAKHPPVSKKSAAMLHQKGDFTIFVKPTMKPISVVTRVNKMTTFLSQNKCKRSYVSLKGLGRAIDTTLLIGCRLQQAGYKVAFTTSTEKVVDEMYGVKEQETSEISKEPSETEQSTTTKKQVYHKVRHVSAVTVKVYTKAGHA